MLCNAIARPTSPSRTIGVPSSTTFATSPIHRPSNRLTMKDGASVTSTQVFFSAFPGAKAVARVASSVARLRTTSTSGMTATG